MKQHKYMVNIDVMIQMEVEEESESFAVDAATARVKQYMESGRPDCITFTRVRTSVFSADPLLVVDHITR